MEKHGARLGLLSGRRPRAGRRALFLLTAPFLDVSGVEKWLFLVNTDGLNTTLSCYFKRIKSEPDFQLETGGKCPVLRELAALEGGEASRGAVWFALTFLLPLPGVLRASP